MRWFPGYAAAAIAAAAVLSVAPWATAETVNCTAITSLPFAISTGGVYCLAGDLSFTSTIGSAIEIGTDNVVLDLKAHTLDGLGAGAATVASGVNAHANNVTIRNGTVRGFYFGIVVTNGASLVEQIRADLNTSVGIYTEGIGTVIRNNVVVGTGGLAMSLGMGIIANGSGSRVLKNDVIDTRGLSGAGIFVYCCAGAVVEGNRVIDGGWGIVVWPSASDAFVIDNHLSNLGYGVMFYCNGKYRDNLTSNVITPFTGGTNAGHNN